MKPTKIYTFIVPASGAFQLLVMGDYFKIMTATGLVEVRGDTFGTIGSILPGQGMRDTAFNRLEFRDVTGAANTVSILVADATFVDDRITGVVEVVDGAKARSIAGVAFLCSSFISPAAGDTAQTVLYNPVGSGKRVVLNSMLMSLSAAGTVGLYQGSAVPSGGASTGVAKAIGSGAVSSTLKYDYQGIAPSGTQIGIVLVPASASILLPMTEPIVVMPGNYFGVRAGAAAVALIATVQFFEEVIL